MELDSRIKEGKRPLTCIDVEQAEEFVGKECIFSDKYENFKNLDKYLFVDNSDYSAILSIDDYTRNGDYVFRNVKNGAHYCLILPLEWVKEPEKKYRAFTIKEFQQKYSVGSVFQIRQKQNRFTESVVQYVGYKVYEDRIYLGITDFTFDELFENFEMIEPQSDTWHPFGVEE